MATTKKYYWLKLKEDFFNDDTIEYIEEQANGKEYCLFYLKMCLKSIRNEGKLIRIIGSSFVPYDIKALSKLTNTDFDVVRSAMYLFEQIGIVSKLETGEIYLNQINEMIGNETSKAESMRKLRAKDKAKGNNVTPISNNVTDVLPICYTEIEKEIKSKSKSKSKKSDFKKITEPAKLDFNLFWDLYDKKTGKDKCLSKWNKLNLETQTKILEYIPKYKIAQPDKKFRKNPETFFNNKSWEDELIQENAIINTQMQTKTRLNYDSDKF